MRSLCRKFFSALFLLGLITVLPSPAKAEGGNTMLILDASGSMWGLVDGQSKISAARSAVDSILSKWHDGDNLGLMAYGHRSKGDCKDIETLIPVGAFDAAKIKSSVAALSPKGKTPIAASLRAAAEALKATENKATVLLVSDGIETCAPDPCAVAAELKKAGIDFKAHVIGFDVTDPAAKTQLQCIAKATGGVYLDARNADSLQNALGKAVEAAQGKAVKSEAPSKPPEDIYKGKNIRGIARLAEGMDPISDNRNEITWSFYKKGSEDEKGDYLTTFYNSPFADSYEPGEYIVEIAYGLVKRLVPVRIETGKRAELDVILDAGYVTSEGTVEGGGKAENVTWEIRDGSGDVFTTVYDAVPHFVVPAGSYTLELSKGAAKAKKDFTIAAGDSTNVAVTLDVGKLLVDATYGPEGPKVDKGIAVEVRTPSKQEGEQGDSVTTVYDPLAKFDLPAGKYDVIVSVGAAKKTVSTEIKSGTPTKLTVNMDAGVAGIKAPGATFIEIFGGERDINNERKSVWTGYETDISLAIGAGEYAIVATFADDKK
ncbi:MAG: VWA domain-containing protein, partial [Pseudomonadota bacterium]